MYMCKGGVCNGAINDEFLRLMSTKRNFAPKNVTPIVLTQEFFGVLESTFRQISNANKYIGLKIEYGGAKMA